jgi:hypothetical protein
MTRRPVRGAHRRPLRPLLLILTGAALVLLAVLLLPRLGAAPGTPALHVEPASVDLGDVPLGQCVQVELTVANLGDGVLRFRERPYVEVREGC